MRNLLISLILLASNISLAENIAGVLIRTGGKYFLRQNLSEPSISLNPQNEKTNKVLSQLNSGDLISGTVLNFGQTVELTSIEYVGLRRLLGTWYSDKTNIEFQSFTEASFLAPGNLKIINSFKYSISPFNETEWYIFISNENKTQVGTISLELQSSELTLKLYDSESGNISEVNHFTRKK